MGWDSADARRGACPASAGFRSDPACRLDPRRWQTPQHLLELNPQGEQAAVGTGGSIELERDRQPGRAKTRR